MSQEHSLLAFCLKAASAVCRFFLPSDALYAGFLSCMGLFVSAQAAAKPGLHSALC